MIWVLKCGRAADAPDIKSGTSSPVTNKHFITERQQICTGLSALVVHTPSRSHTRGSTLCPDNLWRQTQTTLTSLVYLFNSQYLFFLKIHNYSNRNYCLSLAHTRHQLAAPPGCPGTLEQNHWDQARIPAAKSQQMHLLFWSRHHNISRLRRFEMFSLSHRHTPRCWSKYKRAFSEGVSMRRRRSKKKKKIYLFKFLWFTNSFTKV